MSTNERQLKPMRKYEVHTHIYKDGRDCYECDTFTGDEHQVMVNGDGDVQRVQFLNAGNVIKEYFGAPVKIIITPDNEG